MREFKNYEETIYLYFQKIESIRHPWSNISEDSILCLGGEDEALDTSFCGPETYLIYKDTDVFVHTIYGDFKGGLTREKVYEALAYMSDFDFKVGIVLYPGLRFHVKYDRRQTSDSHILIEAPFFPEFTGVELETKKIKDYLRYLTQAAVSLHQAAKRNKDIAPMIGNMVDRVQKKYFASSGVAYKSLEN